MTEGASKKEKPLAGQHAVVTGGGRGIGAAIVRELADLGASVTLMGRNKTRLDQYCRELSAEFDENFHAASADVMKPDAVEEAFAEARQVLGDPGILINNAGGVETAPFIKTGPDDWRRMIDLNLTSVFTCSRQVLPAMLEAGTGRIVNISSTAGLRGHSYISAYSAAKHGVIGLTRSLAIETAKRGITVNAVCPGYTDTDLVTESAKSVAEKTGKSVDEIIKKYKQGNPRSRFVKPEEVAKTVAWLCLPEQGSITGQAIVIDGGETL